MKAKTVRRTLLYRFTAVFMIAMALLAAMPVVPASADSATLYPGTGADDSSGGGTVTWSNPTRVVANDNSYATASVNNNAVTHYLKATNFGFAIPAGSTINGIQLTIGRFENNTSFGTDVRDVRVSLVKTGVVQTTNYANTSLEWPTSETAATYGSASDLWGGSWTVADVNASDFGAVLSVSSNNNRTASVDYMQIAITYTAPPTTTVGDGTSPANKFVKGSETTQAVSAFTLSTNASTDTVTALTIAGSGTGLANVAASGVKLWQDNGSTANEWDATDTAVGTAASFSGTDATFGSLSIPVTTTSTQYLVTVDIVASPADAQTIQARVSSATATTNPVANNDSVDATVTTDITAPSIVIGAPSTLFTRGGPVTFLVTYADTNFNSSTLAAGNVTLNTTGTAAGNVAVTGTGTTRTVTISGITGNGTLGISIAAGTATDKAGNAAPAAGPSATFTVDNLAPTVLSMTATDPNPSTAVSVNWAVTFSETVVNVGTNDFRLVATGLSGTSITGVTGTGAGPYTVTANTGVGNGTLGLNIATTPTVQDSAGNALLTGAVGDVYTVNRSITISGNLGAAAAGSIVYCTATVGTCPASVTADGTGFYTMAVSADSGTLVFTGTLEPTPPSGFYFSPPTRTYTGINTDQTGQNYTLHVVSHTTFYVDNRNISTTCSASGGTILVPFCTISQAAQYAVAGDTVRVLGGTYAETVKPKFGNVDDPVTYIAGPDPVTVTGEAGNSTNGGAFRITQKHDIIIDGFNVTNTADYGIYVYHSTRITIRNNHVSYSGTTAITKVGIYINGTTYSTISGNTSDHNTYHGIQFVNGGSYNTVSHNTSFGNATVLTSRAVGIDFTSNSSNNTVEYNITYANEDSGIDFYSGSSYNQVLGNLSYGNGDHGIDNNGSPHNTIIGNTVQGNVTAGINLEGSPTGSTDGIVKNNIVSDNGIRKQVGGGIVPSTTPGNIRIDSNSLPGAVIDYNLYYLSAAGGGTIQVEWNGDQYSSLTAFHAAHSTQEENGGTGPLEGDPKFKYAAPIAQRPAAAPFTITIPDPLGDYHLSSGSPAIDNANSNSPALALDMDGYARVDDPSTTNHGTGPRAYDDRGAYEFEPTTTTLVSNNNPSEYGETVIFTASVSEPLATGDIEFYDGATLLATVTLSGSPKTAVYSTAALTASGVAHSITAKYMGDGVYPPSVASTPVLQLVQPKPITITPNAGQTKVYGASDPTPFGYSFSPALEGGDSFTGVIGRMDGENVGTYVFTLGTLTAGPNYALSIPASPTFSITIKSITITPNDGQSKVYGAVDPTFTYVPSPALQAGDSFTGGLGRAAGENVNTYAFTPGTLSAGSNYDLTLATGHTFAITAKPITITPNDGQSKVYGAVDPTFTYVPSPALESGDSFTGALGRVAGANVGNYAFTLNTLSAGTNYTLSLASGHTFAITAKAITITPNDGQSKVYGAVDPTFTYVPTPALEAGDSFTGALGRVDGMNVDNYAFTLNTLSAGSNYTLSLAPGHTFAITAKPITITPNDGQSKVYGATDPTFTYTFSPALVTGDSLTGVIGRVLGENVNTYAFTLGTLTAGQNYTLSLAAGHTFAVTPKAITITPNDGQSKIYGAVDPVFTYTASLTPDVAFTGALGRAAGTNVGNYAFTLNTLSAGSNYSLSLAAGHTFAITPKPITVWANTGQSKPYGTTDPVLTYTSSDGGAVFTGALARAAGENVGVYAINQGSLSAGANYTITFVSANFTIVIADQTINFPQPPDKNPGAPDFTVGATATSGLPVSFSSKTLSVCTVSLAGRVHLLKVGTCTLAADQGGNSNYNAAPQVTKSFTVSISVPIDIKIYLPLIVR